MCLDDAFRLCSCDADELAPEEIGWILEVVDPSKPKNPKKGKLAMPSWAAAELTTVHSVLMNLNSGTCCDFEVEHTERYRLQIRVPAETSDKKWLTFSYAGGEWKHHQTSDKFQSWRTQLVPCRQGKVESAQASDAAVNSAAAAISPSDSAAEHSAADAAAAAPAAAVSVQPLEREQSDHIVTEGSDV